MRPRRKENMRSVAPKPIDVQAIPLLTLPFVDFNNRKALPTYAAIYFVLNAHGTVLYIGQTQCLFQRWQGHFFDRFRAHDASRIAWLVMSDDTLLKPVEKACITYFDPICNTRKGRAPDELIQTTLRANATLLRKARFYLNEEGSSINEFCAKQLAQYIEKRERRAPSPLVEPREQQAS